MFGARHYVPLLRWKPAERRALQHIDEGDRDWVTPLVEVVPQRFHSLIGVEFDREAASVADDMANAWPKRHLFLDMQRVKSQSAVHPLRTVAAAAESVGVCLIPVVTTRSTQADKAVIAGLFAVLSRCL